MENVIKTIVLTLVFTQHLNLIFKFVRQGGLLKKSPKAY